MSEKAPEVCAVTASAYTVPTDEPEADGTLDWDSTTLVVAERPDVVVHGNVVYGRWAEDFLADGILHLRQYLVSDVEVARRVRIVKMRGTRHETGYMALLVDDGRLRATRAMAQ